MDLSRRSFLKAGVGVSGVTVPFLAGHRLGRLEADVPVGDSQISRAASSASTRLAGSNDRSAAGESSRPVEDGPDAPPETDASTESGACPVEIERTAVSSDAVEAALDEQNRDRPFAYSRYRLDETLQATDRDTVGTLLACDRTDWNEYTDDFYDCEEFAMSLRTNFVERWELNSVGIVYDESASPIPHVYNMVFYDDATFDLVEPQTDDVVEPGSDERYTFEDVTVLV